MTNILKNFVALLIGCVAALLLLEMVIRFYNPLEFTVKGDKIVLPKNRKYITENRDIRGLDRTIIHTKNSLGFRGEEQPSDSSEYLTLIVVGGSTTECQYLSDGRTWADVLGLRLSRDFSPVWINNAGLDGHSTHGHIILMEDYLTGLKPKLALFLVGINEMGRRDLGPFELQHIRDRIDTKSLRGFMKSISSHSEAFALGLNLYRYYRAVKMGLSHRQIDVDKLDLAPAEISSAPDIEEMEKDLARYEGRLRRLVQIARVGNIDPVLITQPALYGNGIDDVTGIDLARILVNKRDGRDSWKRLEMYNETTRRVGRNENVLVVDLARELPKSSRYFYDFYHFTNEGAERVGDILYAHMSQYLRTKYKNFGRESAAYEPALFGRSTGREVARKPSVS